MTGTPDTTAGQIRPTVALATSNGTGMGHLARQISVGLSLREQADPLFFSLSRAVPIIARHGFRGEYCPSRERGWMPGVRWQDYLRERVCAFVEEAGVDVLVFDGVVPYNGLLQARTDLPNVQFVWMRRGFWRPGVRTAPLRSTPLFDLVLEPGDLASAGDRGATASATDAVRLPPISLAEHEAPLSRQEAAAELGLDPDRPTALVTLSSGVLNDVAGPGTAAVNALLEHPDWQVAVTRTALTQGGVPISDPARCVELRGVYPLVRYLAAFDAAVAAGGYNSVHELLYAGIPTVFVPNKSSGTDDQQARTRWLADNGFALFADEQDLDQVHTQTVRLHEESVRAVLRAAVLEFDRPTGSAVAARALLGLSNAPGSAAGRRRSVRKVEVRARSVANHLLGPRTTAMARRLLGRVPDPGPAEPMPVSLIDELHGLRTPGEGGTPLVLTERLDADLLRGDDPVEHVLAGASERYRAERRQIVGRYFDVRPAP